MKVSLVINTYNRMHTLPATLRSLEFLRYPDLEVIVVDGPSTDGTLAYLEANWAGKVKICKCAEANLSKSRNVGIMNASGDIVCFTDDDGIPEPDWLDNLIAAYADPKVGAAGGWVRNHTGVDYQTKYIVSTRDSTSQVLIENADDVPEAEPGAFRFPGVIGVNSSFRRSALVGVGGFDEEYAYFLDETDVLVRMVDAGYTVKSIPDAQVHHKYAASHIRSTNGAARSWLQIVTSTAYYIVKSAAPGTKLSWCMEMIAFHKKNMINHTHWYLSEKMVDQARHDQLIEEIERGADQGIADAFTYPCRRLIQPHDPGEWRAFPRLLEPAQRLRLAFVTALYPPRPCGGVAVFINGLAKRLAEMGHEITVITQAEPGRSHTVDFEDGVWVHRLPDDDTVAATMPEGMPDMPGNPRQVAGRVLAELDRVNDRRKFQCVVGTIWDMDLAAVIASKRYPTAMYLVTSYKLMEDSKPEWKKNQDFYAGHVLKMVGAETWALGSVDHVLASTRAILRDTEEAYGLKVADDKVVVLPFGVSEPSDSAIAQKLPDAPLELLYVGRFEHRKGADLLLEILPGILQRYPSVVMTCIGDNNIRDAEGHSYTEQFLRQYGNAPWIDRVKFLGHVDDATLESAYANCDIFMAPSRYESFGLIYLEAMRYGKPCIGSTAGGIPEVVDDQETGLLVPPGDAMALEKAVMQLLDDASLRVRMGEAGRKRYLNGFTTGRFAESFEAQVRQWIK